MSRFSPLQQGRWRRFIPRSLRLRLVLVFVLLALAMSWALLSAGQRFAEAGWNFAARPFVEDYVQRLMNDIGDPPQIDQAQALVERLPLTLSIQGPDVQWRSHPERRSYRRVLHKYSQDDSRWAKERFWRRMTSDGHTVEFGIDFGLWERPNGPLAITMIMVVTLVLAAYWYVRRLLSPLVHIGAGVQRFGQGQLDQAIALEHNGDELGQLADHVDAMASDIQAMLDAKRALLLAISHELRSPLTRARLNVELLPDEASTRLALLRDLGVMNTLIHDLLESERLSEGHSALHRECLDIVPIVRDQLDTLEQELAIEAIRFTAPEALEVCVDIARLQLLLGNLVRNACHHGAAPFAVHITLSDGHWCLSVRDHGHNALADETLRKLSEAFYRPDTGRSREHGGIGLGLYLCRLVAQSHGGSLHLENAQPGLRARVQWPRFTDASTQALAPQPPR